MNPEKTRKLLIVTAVVAAPLLLSLWKLSWGLGAILGASMAFTSCHLIQKAVRGSAATGGKPGRRAIAFLIGFLGRFLLFGLLLYLAILYAGLSPVAIAVGFTLVQLTYPYYLVRKLDKRDQQHV